MVDHDRIPLIQLPHVFDFRMPYTAPKIKACMLVDDYAFVCKLFEIGKWGLLEESAFQMLQTTSIVTLVAAGHRELLVSGVLPHEVKYFWTDLIKS